MTSQCACMREVQHKVDILKKKRDTRRDFQCRERYGLSRTHPHMQTPSARGFFMRLIIRSYGWPMHHGERTGVKCLRSGKLFHHTRPRNTSYQLPNKITHNTRCLQKRKTDWGEREYVSVKKKKKKKMVKELKKKKKEKKVSEEFGGCEEDKDKGKQRRRDT